MKKTIQNKHHQLSDSFILTHRGIPSAVLTAECRTPCLSLHQWAPHPQLQREEDQPQV